MDFASDNVVGATEPVIAAVAEAARAGPEGTYGADRWSAEARERLDALFERTVTALFVATGTAANALALQAAAPSGTAVFCHDAAHIIDEECGAPEFYIGGGKLVGVPGAGGKVTPDGLSAALARYPRDVVRQVPPGALSLSQATESGTVYTPGEVAALAGLARQAGLRVHMDGARFANALVGLDCSAADLTWKAGVDVLAFGATKNGALACEAIVFFDEALAARAEWARKRGGHTLSKGRLLGAQMAASLREGHWLACARHANAMAARLAAGLRAHGYSLPWTAGANELFVVLPRAADRALRAAGGHYYEWETRGLEPAERPGPDEVFVRLVCSYETTPDAVDAFVAAAGPPPR